VEDLPIKPICTNKRSLYWTKIYGCFCSKIMDFRTSACPPYHLAFVWGTSAVSCSKKSIGWLFWQLTYNR
jgi:tartrate dehydratase alpha subunit/fumarate hydratase class I-like protein